MEGIERIKILASEIKDSALLKIIEYLLSREDMNEKYLNEEKNLTNMVNYIKSEARKKQNNGIAMIEDQVVFGWAIHYFDETDEQLGLINSSKKEEPKEENICEINEDDSKQLQTNVEKKIIEKKEYFPEGQLTLF